MARIQSICRYSDAGFFCRLLALPSSNVTFETQAKKTQSKEIQSIATLIIAPNNLIEYPISN